MTQRVVKTCQEGQGKAALDVPFVVRVVAVLHYRNKALQFQKWACCGVTRRVKEHSAVVAEKELQLKKTFYLFNEQNTTV